MTLVGVARLAGVAPATVSRVLNSPSLVAQETRNRVLGVIEQTGYVPNVLAGGLASNRSRLIAIIVPSIVNLIYAQTVQSFTARLRDAGYQVLLGEAGYDPAGEEELVTAILGRQPDALLLTGTNHTATCRRRLLNVGLPIVETWDITPTPLDMVIGFSHQAAARAVANHLIAKGHTRFGVVTSGDQRARNRIAAFAAELETRGFTDIATANVPDISSLELGRRGLGELLANGFTGGAVFCSSDTLAQGVIAEAQARQLRIPKDIAIVGFADQPFAAHTHPPLTSVRIDWTAMGTRAADAILTRLDNQPVAETIVDLGFELIVRETT